jgi:rhamnulokinase
MQTNNKYLAFDFGAESSRAVCGHLEKNKLLLREVYRFQTGMLSLDNHFYWNIFRFYEEMLKAMQLCAQKENLPPFSIGIDSWGVDFGFLAEDDSIIRIPYAYRDLQVTEAMPDFHKKKMPAKEIYSLTGISMQPFNSLYHVHAMNRNSDPVLKLARRMMFIPDLLNFLLCGQKKTEFSFATTSQLFNPFKNSWEEELLKAVGLDKTFMNEIISPGLILGGLKESVCRLTGVRSAEVAAVCSHDTGSAIVAVPVNEPDWAYISSGTWSLMGLELEAPLVTEKSFLYNFSNEGGAAGTFRFLKNIMGLWLLQQCQKIWAEAGNDYTYPELIEMASAAVPFKVLLDPDHPKFFNPPDMVREIDDYCDKTSQERPGSVGGYVRAILESLALKYRRVLEQLIETTGKNVSTIHIIGGGSHNKMLCQFTANVTGKKVVAGPSEGTAAGNILMQAIAHNRIGSLGEARHIIRNSTELAQYLPQDYRVWERVYKKFLELPGMK